MLLTQEQIDAFNLDSAIAKGTMVMDLRTANDTFNGIDRNQAVRKSSTADAEYYYGWTYGSTGKKADWPYYQRMIDNCYDTTASPKMPVRYAVAVNRTELHVFPSDNPIWDDPKDPDFNYQVLSSVRVNEPVLIYTTSRDGKYYLARISSCSGWISAEDVAICKDKEEWLSAWDLPSEDILMVWGAKEYTAASNYAPQISKRMLTQGTTLELVEDLAPDQLVNNRSPYHNYVVYLPVRLEDGSYAKEMALIPETADVSLGYLPLTTENIAKAALVNLGDAYGWGGMLEVEDCSGLVRTIYACFGLDIGRNGNWQFEQNIEKYDMTYMSTEEKCLILDQLPLGAALCFSGHEMLYLGKVDGKYYVISTVSSIMSPDTGKRLRTRDVMINTLDVKRANGQTWLQALNKAFMPCYPTNLEGVSFHFPQPQWYHDGVAYALKTGAMPSLSGGNFGIGESADRSSLAKALWVMAGKPSVEGACSFTDVAEDHAARSAIIWCAQQGIMQGVGSTLFAPAEPVTREQLVTVLWRYEQLQEINAEVTGGSVSSFRDGSKIHSYALEAFSWALGAGILTGSEDGLLSPASPALREQMAVVLYRYSQLPRAEAE